MDDLSRKIGEILNDPSALEQIKELTGLLGVGNTEQKSDAKPVSVPAPAGSMPDPSMLNMVMKLAPLMQSANSDDDSTRLLRALKPFMHDERSKRIDSAIRLLGIMKLLPILKGSGPDFLNL